MCVRVCVCKGGSPCAPVSRGLGEEGGSAGCAPGSIHLSFYSVFTTVPGITLPAIHQGCNCRFGCVLIGLISVFPLACKLPEGWGVCLSLLCLWRPHSAHLACGSDLDDLC